MGSWDQFTDWLMKGNQIACYEMVISVRDSTPGCLAMRKPPPKLQNPAVCRQSELCLNLITSEKRDIGLNAGGPCAVDNISKARMIKKTPDAHNQS